MIVVVCIFLGLQKHMLHGSQMYDLMSKKIDFVLNCFLLILALNSELKDNTVNARQSLMSYLGSFYYNLGTCRLTDMKMM